MQIKEQKNKSVSVQISMFHRRIDIGFPLLYRGTEMVKLSRVTVTMT
jgi:hypothetical protein